MQSSSRFVGGSSSTSARLPGVVKMGYMWKRGVVNTSCKYRFFVLLEDGVMLYFKKESFHHPLGVIFLKEAFLKRDLDEIESKGGKANGFSLRTIVKRFTLFCESEDEKDLWIKTIETVIKFSSNKLKTTSTGNTIRSNTTNINSTFQALPNYSTEQTAPNNYETVLGISEVEMKQLKEKCREIEISVQHVKDTIEEQNEKLISWQQKQEQKLVKEEPHEQHSSTDEEEEIEEDQEFAAVRRRGRSTAFTISKINQFDVMKQVIVLKNLAQEMEEQMNRFFSLQQSTLYKQLKDLKEQISQHKSEMKQLKDACKKLWQQSSTQLQETQDVLISKLNVLSLQQSNLNELEPLAQLEMLKQKNERLEQKVEELKSQKKLLIAELKKLRE